jgi:hypothetical protein
MSLYVGDELFNLLVRDFWPDMACQAYGSFVEKGRGVLAIHKTHDAINLEDMKFEFVYTAYDDIAIETDANIARLVREYAPDHELVAQYQRSQDDIHTVLVKTPSGESPPKLTCLFRGFSMADILAEFEYTLTYTPEMVYARARKKGKE